MGVNWAHTPETSINYHQAGPNIEPTMKKKKRTCKKYVETGSPDTHTTRTGFNWGELEKAQDRRLWKTVVNRPMGERRRRRRQDHDLHLCRNGPKMGFKRYTHQS